MDNLEGAVARLGWTNEGTNGPGALAWQRPSGQIVRRASRKSVRESLRTSVHMTTAEVTGGGNKECFY